MNPKPLSISSRAMVPVGIPVSSDKRHPRDHPGGSTSRAQEIRAGRTRTEHVSQAPTTFRNLTATHAPPARSADVAELENGASLGRLGREVKKSLELRSEERRVGKGGKRRR